MSANEKMIEGVFLASKEKNKEFKVSTLKSNGFIPQLVLANEIGAALTEKITKKNATLGQILTKFDEAIDLATTSTRSDNGWFADILTSQRTKQQIQMSGAPGNKVNPMAAMMGGQKPPPAV